MSNLMRYAERELRLAGYFDKDGPYGGMFGPAVLKMVEIFSQEGHSGGSAPIAIGLFERVANFEPLAPLTGEANEWVEVEAGKTWQNNRCSHVFKDAIDGEAYDSTGRIFRLPDGVAVLRRDSRVPITFPYTPTREYIDVAE